MQVKTRVLDETGQPVFQGHTKINAQNLILVAKSREAFVREKGEAWAADAIPVLGKELIKLMKTEQLGEVMDNAAITVAMAAWLNESVYCGLPADRFMASDLEFVMSHDGIVAYTRLPGTGV
jgi:hypothetical protein